MLASSLEVQEKFKLGVGEGGMWLENERRGCGVVKAPGTVKKTSTA